MKSFKIIITIFCFLLILPNFINKAYSQLNSNPKPEGILIDAGGHKLHLNIKGNGSPSVIFENGSADFSFVWSLVQPEVTRFTKTVSYDRAGYAWSEPGPTPRTSKQICFELHAALQSAGIKAPYILVGQSFGGFLVRAFARYYPNEVTGMVLVDAVQEDERIFMGSDTPKRIRQFAQGRLLPPVKTFFKPVTTTIEASALDSTIEFPLNKLSPVLQQLQIWAQSQPSYRDAAMAEMDWSPEDVADMHKNKDKLSYKLGNIPLIVLTKGNGGYDGRTDSAELENERLKLQGELVHLSKNSKHNIDKNSGHNIHLEDPVIVINAIKEIFWSIKNNKHLR